MYIFKLWICLLLHSHFQVKYKLKLHVLYKAAAWFESDFCVR